MPLPLPVVERTHGSRRAVVRHQVRCSVAWAAKDRQRRLRWFELFKVALRGDEQIAQVAFAASCAIGRLHKLWRRPEAIVYRLLLQVRQRERAPRPGLDRLWLAD